MAFDGLGEIELHYHHDNDTSETLRASLRDVIAAYQRRGVLLATGHPARTAFAFIHGDWALDNSCYGRYCGVNDELTILQELGCWGDFTMPSSNECQTRKINSIYYALDDPLRAKSHDRGINARVGNANPMGLFLMQGPLAITLFAPRFPHMENAALTSRNWGQPHRMRTWINCGIHVRGRPEWVFVKLHAHGGPEKDHDALFGEKAFRMHKLMNDRYNDGKKYRLHYVTAREAYNICKAAEQGYSGDPDQYRNFAIPSYATSRYVLNRDHEVKECSADMLRVTNIAIANERAKLRIPGPVISLEGQLREVTITNAGRRVECGLHGSQQEIFVTLSDGVRIRELVGGTIESEQSAGTGQTVMVVKSAFNWVRVDTE
jgi:hypothetical protein